MRNKVSIVRLLGNLGVKSDHVEGFDDFGRGFIGRNCDLARFHVEFDRCCAIEASNSCSNGRFAVTAAHFWDVKFHDVLHVILTKWRFHLLEGQGPIDLPVTGGTK